MGGVLFSQSPSWFPPAGREGGEHVLQDRAKRDDQGCFFDQWKGSLMGSLTEKEVFDVEAVGDGVHINREY